MNNAPKLWLTAALLCGIVLMFAHCTKHEVTVHPIKIEPIYMTIDVNIKVQRELDDFFSFEEQIENNSDTKR